MIPLEIALERILARASVPVGTETVSLGDALGRTLASSVVAPFAVPAFDNSAMDGYALRALDARPGQALPVVQRIAAGDDPGPLSPGGVARIFTGAPLPAGADAVVMQEDCEAGEEGVRLRSAVRPGDNVRPAGEDMAENSVALERGRRLRPQDIGLIASLGYDSVTVYRRLRVAVLSTGSELREAGGAPLSRGAIYNSNAPMLAALLQAQGMDVVGPATVADTADATRKALEAGSVAADVVLSSGGVSVGEEDHVRAQVEALGSLDLWKIALKPGKPFAFGHIGETPFLGLPGNPTSALVTFLLLARPFLQRCQGQMETPLPAMRALAGFSVATSGGRTEYLRVHLAAADGALVAHAYPKQGSGVLRSVCASDALAVVPAGRTVSPGDPLEILLLDTLTG